MSQEKIKSAAKKVNAKAEPAADRLLRQVIDHPYSWLLVLAYSMLMIALGKFVL